MTPATFDRPLPSGYRFMLAHEGERLDFASPIVLFTADGELCHGTVRGINDAGLIVGLRSGAIVTLDLDDADFWPEGENRDRRPPMSADGEFVALKEVLATPDEEIEPLMKVGTALAGLAKNDPELAAALADVQRILLNRLRGKAA